MKVIARGKDDEVGKVMQMLEELVNVEGIDRKKIFAFGNLLGDGSSASHFIINFTCLEMLDLLPDSDDVFTLYNIDMTHKIDRNRFPLMVFGRSDMNGTVHPIVVSIFSHETEDDFYHFYQAFKELCAKLKKKFKPTFIMQDACRACLNATQRAFEGCTSLMCWFHVTKCLFERFRDGLFPHVHYKKVVSEIYDMRFSMSETQFKSIKTMALNRWMSLPELSNFSKYFTEQWLDSVFSKWQIYHSPAGFATTNSGIEGFNGVLKSVFTEREVLPIYDVVELLRDKLFPTLITSPNEFKLQRLANKEMNEAASLIETRREKFIQVTPHTMSYNNSKPYIIDTLNKTCTCKYYFKFKLCGHVIVACRIQGVSYLVQPRPKQFVTRERRGRKKESFNKQILK